MNPLTYGHLAQMVKCLPTMQETRVQSLGWKDLLEKEMAIHSSIPAWKIPWTEEPGRLQSMGLQRVGHDWATSLSFFHGHLIFDKGGKNIQWRKDNLFNKWYWENWSTPVKEWNWEYFLTPYTKINSKWIKYLNVRPETIKLLEENIGKTPSDTNHSRILYDPPPRVMEIKAKINKWDLIKLKTFCTMKETRSKVKKSLQNGRK